MQDHAFRPDADVPSRPDLKFEFIAGRISLDFINTTSRRTTDAPRERFLAYEDLIAWSQAADLFGPIEAARLRVEAERSPEAAKRAVACAVKLREALYRIFTAEERGERGSPEDMATLNGALIDGMARRRLRAADVGYCWAWEEQPDGLDWMLWPVAYSAAQVLSGAELAQVKECKGDNCNWLFLDVSRNHSRCWCTMRDCGNKAKARRHYARRKRETADS